MDDQIRSGIRHGYAVAYLPANAQLAHVSLRNVGARMLARGQLPEVGADDRLVLLDELDHQDDRPSVGAGRVRRGLRKPLRKVVKKAKKLANSKLATAVVLATSTAATGSPMYGTALLAVRDGIRTARQAARDPQGAAAQAAPIAAALADGRITPSAASRAARRIGIAAKSIKSAAVALRVQRAADDGSSAAQNLLDDGRQLEAASQSRASLPGPDDLTASTADVGEPDGMYDADVSDLAPTDDAELGEVYSDGASDLLDDDDGELEPEEI